MGLALIRNFRENVGRVTGELGEGAHAHHMLPQAFADKFEAAGLNVHDPRFGTWWEKAEHLEKAADFNKQWRGFFQVKRGKEEMLQFARQLGETYGLKVDF